MPRRSAGASGPRSGSPSSSAGSPRTMGSTTPSPTPIRETRRGTWRTRWGPTEGTCSCPYRHSATSRPSTGGSWRHAWRSARARSTTGSAGPNPSSSQRTGRPSRRCRLPGSPASGGRRGNAAGRAPSRSAASTATPPALPTRAARSPSRSAPSASPSATAGPARPSRHTGGSGAGHRRTARIPCSS